MEAAGLLVPAGGGMHRPAPLDGRPRNRPAGRLRGGSRALRPPARGRSRRLDRDPACSAPGSGGLIPRRASASPRFRSSSESKAHGDDHLAPGTVRETVTRLAGPPGACLSPHDPLEQRIERGIVERERGHAGVRAMSLSALGPEQMAPDPGAPGSGVALDAVDSHGRAGLCRRPSIGGPRRPAPPARGPSRCARAHRGRSRPRGRARAARDLRHRWRDRTPVRVRLPGRGRQPAHAVAHGGNPHPPADAPPAWRRGTPSPTRLPIAFASSRSACRRSRSPRRPDHGRAARRRRGHPARLGVTDWRCYGAADLSAPVLHDVRLGAPAPLLALHRPLAWRWRDRPAAVIPLHFVVFAKLFLRPLVPLDARDRPGRVALRSVLYGAARDRPSRGWPSGSRASPTTRSCCARSRRRTRRAGTHRSPARSPWASTCSLAHVVAIVLGLVVLGLSLVVARRGDDAGSLSLALAACPPADTHRVAALLRAAARADRDRAADVLVDLAAAGLYWMTPVPGELRGRTGASPPAWVLPR